MNNKFYIGETSVGKGLFAARDMNKGEKILEFKGSVVNGYEAVDLDLEKYGKLYGNALQIEEDSYIYLEEPGRIINHSCNPNAGIRNNTELISIKKINKNEEIRYDYSCAMDEDDWTMNCSCYEKNCRDIIKDFKFLPEETKKKYFMLNIVQSFIAEKYIKPE